MKNRLRHSLLVLLSGLSLANAGDAPVPLGKEILIVSSGKCLLTPPGEEPRRIPPFTVLPVESRTESAALVNFKGLFGSVPLTDGLVMKWPAGGAMELELRASDAFAGGDLDAAVRNGYAAVALQSGDVLLFDQYRWMLRLQQDLPRLREMKTLALENLDQARRKQKAADFFRQSTGFGRDSSLLKSGKQAEDLAAEAAELELSSQQALDDVAVVACNLGETFKFRIQRLQARARQSWLEASLRFLQGLTQDPLLGTHFKSAWNDSRNGEEDKPTPSTAGGKTGSRPAP